MITAPYGGSIKEHATPERVFKKQAGGIKEALTLTKDELINLFNLAVGCYSPVGGFMNEGDYEEVLDSSRLTIGLDWTIPIILCVHSRPKGSKVLLCDKRHSPVGILEVESVFKIDAQKFCRRIFGTLDKSHPGVRAAMARPSLCLGGNIIVNRSGIDKLRYFQTPAQIRRLLMRTGNSTFTAFSTRNICHIGHLYLHSIALEVTDMLGINVITGPEVKGSFLPEVVFDTYERFIENYYPHKRVFLNNLRLPAIYAGPKEAFLQAVMLQNYGFTHFIVGRDHAGTGKFYTKYGSQKIFEELKALDINILPLSEPRFCKACGKVTTDRSCRHDGAHVWYLNGRDVRRHLTEKNYSKLKLIISEDMIDRLSALIHKEKKPIFY